MIPVRENQWGRYNLHRNIQYFGGMDPIFGCSLPTVFHVKHITVSASDMSVADVSMVVDSIPTLCQTGCVSMVAFEISLPTPYGFWRTESAVYTDWYAYACCNQIATYACYSCPSPVRPAKGCFLLVLVLFLMQSIHAVGANSWYLKHVSNHIPLETFPVVSVLTSGVLCYRLVAWVRKETGYISHEDRLKKTALVLSPTSNPQFNKNPQISHLQS